ncbi:hypothetical protein HBB16_07645 [Pseudonocardia sp. MCCB 268]|nr:hypothetical protein [Pseudonocardia cytotoxica]
MVITARTTLAADGPAALGRHRVADRRQVLAAAVVPLDERPPADPSIGAVCLIAMGGRRAGRGVAGRVGAQRGDVAGRRVPVQCPGPVLRAAAHASASSPRPWSRQPPGSPTSSRPSRCVARRRCWRRSSPTYSARRRWRSGAVRRLVAATSRAGRPRSRREGLLRRHGRRLLLVAAAAQAVLLFLGGGYGPWLPNGRGASSTAMLCC